MQGGMGGMGMGGLGMGGLGMGGLGMGGLGMGMGGMGMMNPMMMVSRTACPVAGVKRWGAKPMWGSRRWDRLDEMRHELGHGALAVLGRPA